MSLYLMFDTVTCLRLVSDGFGLNIFTPQTKQQILKSFVIGQFRNVGNMDNGGRLVMMMVQLLGIEVRVTEKG
ncbi:hypothetical protein VNO77_01339 [Canavalia gladiata]|uniref:Uncharacterized protein n=1 Tax=Canavalia gladiata TaxID=3824 RepID=A0AAN9MSX2_CANGL